MAKISFSYFVQDKLDPKTNQVIGHILRPYIPIRLSLFHGNPTNHVNALVDSGSDRNLFPIQWGQILGIPFRKIKPVHISGIGNSTVTAFPYKVNIWVNNKKYETDADFSPQQKTPLLGRSGFFNLFEEIIFEEIKGFLHIVV